MVGIFTDRLGFIGKSEHSAVIYRVGECMQELIKLWKEYESSQGEKGCSSSQNGPTLEIWIPVELVTATNLEGFGEYKICPVSKYARYSKSECGFQNSQGKAEEFVREYLGIILNAFLDIRVRGGQLWGTDIYTDDSDLVAVLTHTGYYRPAPATSPPPPAIQELRVVIRVLPPQDCYSYISTLRNNVRSRAWGAAIGCSYRVERCCILKKGGGTIDLEPCLTHTSTVEPTLALVFVERTMSTRAAASNALRRQRFVREVTIQYNLCNEPWIKYSISAIADRGLKRPLYTSARLKKGEVLYLESHSCRYELCFNGEKMVKAATAALANQAEADRSQSHYFNPINGEKSAMHVDSVLTDVFRWSRCKKPLPQKLMCCIGIPLPLEHLEVLEDNLDWEDIEWSQKSVWIARKEYLLVRVHFLASN